LMYAVGVAEFAGGCGLHLQLRRKFLGDNAVNPQG